MGKIINVLGPHGVGKTSLWKYIEEHKLGLVFDGFQLPLGEDDIHTKDGYLSYELKYIKRINEENNIIKNSNQNGFIIRSIEELVYFLKTSKFDYDENLLNNIVRGNISSDIVIYLDASFDVLKDRYEHDEDRDMEETLDWYANYYEGYDSYLKKLSNIRIIDTTNLSVEEVYQKIQNIINED